MLRSFVFSQSSLQDYADCPRRFQLRYIERLAWPAVEAEPAAEDEHRQQEGRYFHRLVQQYLLGLPADKIASLANTPNLERWWSNFQKSFERPAGAQIELALSAPIGEHRLMAKYDLLVVANERATIYDWKTYRRRPRDEWMAARWQTRLYRALLLRAGASLKDNTPFQPEQIEIVYWYAEFPSEPARFAYTSAQYQRDWSAIEAVIREISQARHFPLTADENLCRFCVYRSYCLRAARAGHIDEAEMRIEVETEAEPPLEQIGEMEF